MNDKAFLDSNILVYCFDTNNLQKQKKARELVERLAKSKTGRISTQSLQEFFNVVTKKLKCRKEDAQKDVEGFSQLFPVYCITPKDILTAISISIKTQFHFYDSLILAASS